MLEPCSFLLHDYVTPDDLEPASLAPSEILPLVSKTTQRPSLNLTPQGCGSADRFRSKISDEAEDAAIRCMHRYQL